MTESDGLDDVAWAVGNSTYANVALILRRFSLPSSRDQMRAYLAGHGNES